MNPDPIRIRIRNPAGNLPDVRILYAGEAGGLNDRVGMGVSDAELAGLVVAVGLDEAHVVLVLGRHLLVLLGIRKGNVLHQKIYFKAITPVGYSDFHNLMGFTSKKMPNNIL